MDESYQSLVREYWRLREELSRDEGMLAALQKVVLLYHNLLWKDDHG